MTGNNPIIVIQKKAFNSIAETEVADGILKVIQTVTKENHKTASVFVNTYMYGEKYLTVCNLNNIKEITSS